MNIGKLIPKNFLKYMKDTNLKIQEAQCRTIKITLYLTFHRETAENQIQIKWFTHSLSKNQTIPSKKQQLV